MFKHSVAAIAVAVAAASQLAVGQQTPAPPQRPPQAPRPEPKMDPERAKKLYVSNDPDDNALGHNFQRDIDEKKQIDLRFAEASKGVINFQRVSYRSSIGDLDIPAYLFQPLTRRGTRGHSAMVRV